jgi:intracellular sulfur oxidation DsrE/DsrF family protein
LARRPDVCFEIRNRVIPDRSLPKPVSRRAAFLLGAGSLAGGLIAPRASETRPLKIVLHISDADGWECALSNLKIVTAQRPDAKLRVIVEGSGVIMLQSTTFLAPLFARYSGQGVEFQACRDALDEKKISPSALPSFVKVIPVAAVALAELQYSGFAYIKP